MSVVLCVPVTKAHAKHTPHLMEWYAANKEKHDMHLHWELGKPLHKVQSSAVEVAKEVGADHILFTEHDQWGYPVDGLDVLMDQDKDVVGLMTYMRAYPYLPMCMKKKDKDISFITQERNLISFYPTEVMEKTDLITWAFTLVKTDVFRRMEKEGRNPWMWDTVPTDSHFCQHCEEMGIDRWINACYVVNHGDLPKEHVVFFRRMFDSINASHKRFPIGSLAYREGIEVPQNEEDPHGVVPYKDQIEEILENENLRQRALEIARPIIPVTA